MKRKEYTKFASPKRSLLEQIKKRHKQVLQREFFVRAFNAFPEITLVLDQNRQIVYCNKEVLNFLKKPMEKVLGKRPGEAFGCIYSKLERSGCGTSMFCRECGAVKSILIAQKAKRNTEECRMIIMDHGKRRSLDLRVTSAPINIDREKFVVFAIQNIADEKRRRVLEQTFFHDILNTIAVLSSAEDNMLDGIMPIDKKMIERLNLVTKEINETIQSHRDLLAAEEGRLPVERKEFLVSDFLRGLVDDYSNSRVAKNRTVVFSDKLAGQMIKTDKVLLRRVLGNLVKNALEASSKKATVNIKYERSRKEHLFSVHNPEVMPVGVRHQIFQRSFSTKGKGRGIGTYSVKLLTEKYLRGSVSFESKAGKGTTFFVRI